MKGAGGFAKSIKLESMLPTDPGILWLGDDIDVDDWVPEPYVKFVAIEYGKIPLLDEYDSKPDIKPVMKLAPSASSFRKRDRHREAIPPTRQIEQSTGKKDNLSIQTAVDHADLHLLNQESKKLLYNPRSLPNITGIDILAIAAEIRGSSSRLEVSPLIFQGILLIRIRMSFRTSILFRFTWRMLHWLTMLEVGFCTSD